MSQVDVALLEAALNGDGPAVRQLVDAMAPVVQARAARVLLKRGTGNIRSDVEDLSQEVFVALFTKDAHTLRSWKPSGGLSFVNFVGLVAQRRAASIYRKRGVLREDFDEERTDVSAHLLSSPECSVASRQMLVRLLESLEMSLSPRGYELFLRLYIRQESASEVCQGLGLTQNAVHQWRSRLGSAARQALSELQLGTSAPGPGLPSGTPSPSVQDSALAQAARGSACPRGRLGEETDL